MPSENRNKNLFRLLFVFLLYDNLKSSSFVNYFPVNVLLKNKSKLLSVLMLMKTLNIHTVFYD